MIHTPVAPRKLRRTRRNIARVGLSIPAHDKKHGKYWCRRSKLSHREGGIGLVRLMAAKAPSRAFGTANRKAVGVLREQCSLVEPSGGESTPGPCPLGERRSASDGDCVRIALWRSAILRRMRLRTASALNAHGVQQDVHWTSCCRTSGFESTPDSPKNKPRFGGLFFGGEGGIRTHVPGEPDHLISSQRRYGHFGTSPKWRNILYQPHGRTWARFFR